MINLFIDESGTMTTKYSNSHKYFVIAIVQINDDILLKHSFKKAINKFKKDILKYDTNQTIFQKINDNYKFKEFKGSSLPFNLKVNILKFLYYKNSFNVFYIVINNEKVKSSYYDNTARAFNYILNKELTYLIKSNKLNMEEISLHIDQRNTSTKTTYFLQEYLNTELFFEFFYNFNIKVQYYDSKNKIGIQVADLFANMLYSVLYNKKRSSALDEFITNGCIKHRFLFPLEKLAKKED